MVRRDWVVVVWWRRAVAREARRHAAMGAVSGRLAISEQLGSEMGLCTSGAAFRDDSLRWQQ
jgi:hypothetical protein